MINAQIVCDSVGPNGIRITTFVLVYPRFIHSEFLTHRVFSRNASSSRAIPVSRTIQEVIDNPVIPLAFTRNQKGMQGGEALENEAHDAALAAWLEGRDHAVSVARKLAGLEVHKQYSNRILEPYARITVVATGTDFSNFFALRNHPMAQPEIHALAKDMLQVYRASGPKKLKAGQWHLPFITVKDWEEVRAEVDESEVDALLVRRSAAKCARTSFNNHDGTNTTLEQDLGLYDRLAAGIPMHASPMEHQAMAVSDPNVRSGNFRGWIQYRQGLVGQNITEIPELTTKE
jgi:thymidylate synthase ThyX